MNRIVFALAGIGMLAGCASDPMVMKLPPADGSEPPPPVERVQREEPRNRSVKTFNMVELKNELGMNREVSDLGFADKDFDGCRTVVKGDQGECGTRFLSIVNFRLVCRDTVGTTSRAPSSLTPLIGNLEWRFAGASGHTRTNEQGYGQVQVVSNGPVGSQRFILIIGSKTVGLEASEVTQIVLPKNFCQQHLAME